MKTLDQKMESMGHARRKKVQARAARLIAEEVRLQELRQARKLTQAQGCRCQPGRRFPYRKA